MSATVRKSSDIQLAREVVLRVARWLREEGEDFPAGVLEWTEREHMWRGFTGRQTRDKRNSLNPALAAEIRAYAALHPEMSQDEIGRVFDVAGGRVSEALAGHDWSPGKRKRRK
jgi:hypothetical protein